MNKQKIFAVCVIVLLSGISVFAQKGISGDWEWTGPMDKQKRQNYFSIRLTPKRGKVSGTYFYNQLENGETESDGGVTPFIGTVTGDTVKIEFDPEAEDPGYTENVRYKRPRGKAPSTATLTLKNGTLVWVQTRGSLGKGMPKQFTLKRSKAV